MKFREELEYDLNIWMVFVLAAVLIGGYAIQHFLSIPPCAMCMMQRWAMIGIAVGSMFNIQFGIKPLHYGFSQLAAFLGGAVSVKQLSLDLTAEVHDFQGPIFGLGIYVWAFIVFAAAVLAISWMLFLYSPYDKKKAPLVSPIAKFSFVLIFLLTLGNAITAFRVS